MTDVIEHILRLNEEGKDKSLDEVRTGLIELWNIVPEPKENVRNVYLIVEKIVLISLRIEDFKTAEEWAEKSTRFRSVRNDVGESEFLIGKVAFQLGNMEKAKENFSVANKKSKGRIFYGEDKRFKELLK